MFLATANLCKTALDHTRSKAHVQNQEFEYAKECN